MSYYIVTIKLGETDLHCRVEAKSRKQAADKAVGKLYQLPEDNPARQAFVKYYEETNGKGSFDVKVEDDAPPAPIREGRFKIEPSKKKEGWWVVTDTDNLIVISFEEHRFHETQHIVPLADSTPEALTLATALREVADWLRAKHYDLIF